MENFNHYTVNTGHMRRSTPDEVDKGMYFYLKRIVEDAQTEKGAEILDGTTAELTIDQYGSYAITLFGYIDGEKIPFLISFGCKGANTKEVWDDVKRITKEILKKETNISPMPPFVADIILPTSSLFLHTMSWTGDFTRCIGWYILAPEEFGEPKVIN